MKVKKTYEQPAIETIELLAEDQLLNTSGVLQDFGDPTDPFGAANPFRNPFSLN